MRALVIPLCAVLLVIQDASAGSGGSLYSIFGIGDLRYSPSVRNTGMGGAGIGLPGSAAINTLSPATWARINRTRIDAGLLYEGFRSTNGGTSRYLARMDFNGALIAIPVAPSEGIVFVGGFVPYSNVSFDTYSAGTFRNATDTLDYTLHQVGAGGITRAMIGLSYAPLEEIAFGASLNYLFGSLEQSTTMSATQTAFSGGSVTDKTTITGLTVTFGAVITGFGAVSESLRPLSLGFFVSSRGNLRTRDQSTYAFRFLGERDTSSEVRGRFVVPIAYGVGLGYQVGEQYVVAADAFLQPWKDSEFKGSTPEAIRDSHRFSVGAERLPSREASPSWLNRWAYRLGAFYHATYYEPNGISINEWALTGGVSIPITADTRLNLALEYGSRGTTSGRLIKDNIYRISASLSISEPWFIRYEEE